MAFLEVKEDFILCHSDWCREEAEFVALLLVREVFVVTGCHSVFSSVLSVIQQQSSMRVRFVSVTGCYMNMALYTFFAQICSTHSSFLMERFLASGTKDARIVL